MQRNQDSTPEIGATISLTVGAVFKSSAVLLLLLLVSLACAFSGNGEEAPETTEQTPVGDVIKFVAPIYSTTLKPGERVPATQMTYVNHDGNIYNVTIDGLVAAKSVGDSFSWRGVIGPGVIAKYNLRISPTFITDDLLVGGPVDLWVLNPVPVELATGVDQMPAAIHFTNMAIDYTVPKGGQVPGTSLVFEGTSDQGAQLSGTSGYPYRAQGDTLIWAGRLRGNVNVRYSLRLATVNEDNIRLLGTAEIWVTSL